MKYIPSSIAKWKRVVEERQKKYSAMFETICCDVEDQIVCVCQFPLLYLILLIYFVETREERLTYSGTLIRERQRHHLRTPEAAWASSTM